MTRKFRAGDIVKLEGKLDNRANDIYCLSIDLGKGSSVSFTEQGEYEDGCDLKLELVEAAPVELAVGAIYENNYGTLRVILEIFKGDVYFRSKAIGDEGWDADCVNLATFERLINE